MITAILATSIAVQALGMVINIATVGQPRKPRTPGEAALGTVLGALFIAGFVYVLVSQ